MAFTRAAKRPLGMLIYASTKLSRSGRGYSTFASKGTVISQSTGISNASFLSKYSESFGICSRRFTAEAPPGAQQMNLIKQLRERTSAPIKDVKAALVECNWDIGISIKNHLSFLF